MEEEQLGLITTLVFSSTIGREEEEQSSWSSTTRARRTLRKIKLRRDGGRRWRRWWGWRPLTSWGGRTRRRWSLRILWECAWRATLPSRLAIGAGKIIFQLNCRPSCHYLQGHLHVRVCNWDVAKDWHQHGPALPLLSDQQVRTCFNYVWKSHLSRSQLERGDLVGGHATLSEITSNLRHCHPVFHLALAQLFQRVNRWTTFHSIQVDCQI